MTQIKIVVQNSIAKKWHTKSLKHFQTWDIQLAQTDLRPASFFLQKQTFGLK